MSKKYQRAFQALPAEAQRDLLALPGRQRNSILEALVSSPDNKGYRGELRTPTGSGRRR